MNRCDVDVSNMFREVKHVSAVAKVFWVVKWLLTGPPQVSMIL